MARLCWIAALGLAFSFVVSAAVASAEDKADDPIAGIGPVGPVERLHTGFMFTEGPAPDRKGNVYFTDIPANRIYRVDTKADLKVFIQESNHANGLMVNAAGELVACEMDGQIAAYDVKTKERRVVVQQHGGKRFNACNDLVIDHHGGIYFTDPHFRAPDPLPQGKQAVYYATPEGDAKRLIDDLPAPNGVMLSPEEDTLYVFPSGQADMMAYPVIAPGELGKGRVFFTLKQPEGKKNTGADGVTIDTKGNLYMTSFLGLQVVSPKGKLLGIIDVPEKPANVAFGGAKMDTLFITARTSLYVAKMLAKGHRFAEKGEQE